MKLYENAEREVERGFVRVIDNPTAIRLYARLSMTGDDENTRNFLSDVLDVLETVELLRKL